MKVARGKRVKGSYKGATYDPPPRKAKLWPEKPETKNLVSLCVSFPENGDKWNPY